MATTGAYCYLHALASDSTESKKCDIEIRAAISQAFNQATGTLHSMKEYEENFQTLRHRLSSCQDSLYDGKPVRRVLDEFRMVHELYGNLRSQVSLSSSASYDDDD